VGIFWMRERIVSAKVPSGAGSSDSDDAPAGQPSGLLHVEFDYPVDQLEELHDWYNTEHIPERVSIPGFVTGGRYAAIEGSPRWSALYELETPAVLETEAYLHFKEAGETVWTRRILLTSRPNFRRTEYELLWGAAGTTGQSGPAGPPGLFSVRLTAANGERPALATDDPDVQALLAAPGVGRGRLYRDRAAPTDQLFLAELHSIWAVQSPEFRQAWTRLAARLADQSVAHARGVQMLIL
jgi:hypothetical protein